MINRILNPGIVMLAAAICLLPATGSASQFTMSGASGSTIMGTGSSEEVIIDWNTLSVGSTMYTTNNYVETYTNTGLLTLKEGGTTILSITEAANLAGTFNGSSVSLYSAPSALTISAPLLTELGLSTNPPLSALTAGSYSITAPSPDGSGSTYTNTVTSETSSFTVTVATPEPSTFVMFGLALLAVIGYTARKRLV